MHITKYEVTTLPTKTQNLNRPAYILLVGETTCFQLGEDQMLIDHHLKTPYKSICKFYWLVMSVTRRSSDY